MRGRIGTVVVVAVWLGQWGTLYIHGAFIFLTTLVSIVIITGLIVSRDEAFNFGGAEKSRVWMPWTRRELRHNARARLLREIATLKEKQTGCEALIRGFRGDEATRIPVLEAERDAAARELVRLNDDLARLKMTWLREDREREYRRLTA
jgi:hypothetical protein